MPWGSSPVVSHAQTLGQNGGTSSGVNTTSADTIFLVVGHETAVAPSLTDSNSNTWALIRTHDNGFGRWNSLFRTATTATVGAGHTFTVSLTNGVIGIALTAFAGGATSSIDDQENSNGATFSTSIQTGSITPSEPGTLIIAGCNASDSGRDPDTIDSGFTVAAHVAEGGGGTVGFGTGIAYLVQGAAAAVNPTWSITGGSATHVIATIASFKAASAGAGGDLNVLIGEPITGSSVLN